MDIYGGDFNNWPGPHCANPCTRRYQRLLSIIHAHYSTVRHLRMALVPMAAVGRQLERVHPRSKTLTLDAGRCIRAMWTRISGSSSAMFLNGLSQQYLAIIKRHKAPGRVCNI
uniref:Uncharacterized protein n=1 Tax=Colletotrichum scovillei TaxID=1209932 RepID=A0A9P7R6T1_9PEZI